MFHVFLLSVPLVSAVSLALAIGAYHWWGVRARKGLLCASGLCAVGFCFVGVDAIELARRAAARRELVNEVSAGTRGIVHKGMAEAATQEAMVLQLVVVIATSAAVMPLLAVRWLLIWPPGTRRTCLTFLALVCTCGLIGWTSYRLVTHIGHPFMRRGDQQASGVTLREVTDETLVTDLGRAIPVYEVIDLDDLAESTDPMPREFDEFLIWVADPDSRSNAFGWLFANGRFIVLAESVERILVDNGYDAVEQPKAGDLIGYRNPANELVHMGVVRCVLDNGKPLIESKWGFGGRFLHLPWHQAYSATFVYYRSARGSDQSMMAPRHELGRIGDRDERDD